MDKVFNEKQSLSETLSSSTYPLFFIIRKRKNIFTMKSMEKQEKAETKKKRGKKRLVNLKKLPPFFRSSRKYGHEQCSDFCSGRRKRKVA